MSAARDQQNAAAIRRMLSSKLAFGAAPQVIAAQAAGGGGPAVESDVVVPIPGALTVGAVVTVSGVSVTAADGVRCTYGVVISVAQLEDMSWVSVVLLWGTAARSGTVGPLYVDASGSISGTYPGDPSDETATAPWVYRIGDQVATDTMLIRPLPCFRPRTVTYCGTDGSSAIEVIIHEEPA